MEGITSFVARSTLPEMMSPAPSYGWRAYEFSTDGKDPIYAIDLDENANSERITNETRFHVLSENDLPFWYQRIANRIVSCFRQLANIFSCCCSSRPDESNVSTEKDIIGKQNKKTTPVVTESESETEVSKSDSESVGKVAKDRPKIETDLSGSDTEVSNSGSESVGKVAKDRPKIEADQPGNEAAITDTVKQTWKRANPSHSALSIATQQSINSDLPNLPSTPDSFSLTRPTTPVSVTADPFAELNPLISSTVSASFLFEEPVTFKIKPNPLFADLVYDVKQSFISH